MRAVFRYGGLLVLTLSLSACTGPQVEQFRKKFIREGQAKKDERILTEPVRRSYEEYYQEHFLYFTTWQSTLVDHLGKNRKREAEALREARRHLVNLPKYLEDEKAERLLELIDAFDLATKELKAEAPGAPERLGSRNRILARQIARVGLRIEKEFAFGKVRPFLRNEPSRIDLAPYEDDDRIDPVDL